LSLTIISPFPYFADRKNKKSPSGENTRRDFKGILFAKPHALECSPDEIDNYFQITLFCKKMTGLVSYYAEHKKQ
jgi:hypothetical protein